MSLYEAKNPYEVLVSLIFALQPVEDVTKNTIIYNGSDQSVSDRLFSSLTNSGLQYVKIDTKSDTLRSYLEAFRWVYREKCTIYIFHEVSAFALLAFFLSRKINLIEHGEINYSNIHDVYKEISVVHPYKILKSILREQYVGEGSIFKSIYLRDIDRAPILVRKKAILFCLSELFNKLTEKNQNIVYNIFQVKKAELIVDYETTILVTQPFSELGLMNENEKLQMYSDLLNSHGNNVCLKPHPNEETDYSQYFKNTKILDRRTPLELYVLANEHKLHFLTITSSVKNIKDVKVTKLGETFINQYRGQ